MPEALRWGIIGCGDVVEHKSGPAIQQAGNSVIAAVIRRDGAKARAYAERNSVPLWTGDPSEVIESPGTDIVYVATPPSSHLEYVLAAAIAGKHVLVEKPMGLSVPQAQEMITVCESAGVHLFVAYYRRFHPHVLEMKALIQAGRIGDPVQSFIDLAVDVSCWPASWKEDPKISGGGYFVDLASHRLDAMVYMLGDIQEAHGVTTTFDEAKQVEQAVSLCMTFKSGAQCVVSGDFCSGRAADRFMIAGTCGSLASDPLDGHAFSLVSDGQTENFEFDKFSAPHLGLIPHIEGVIAGRTGNESSGQDGLLTEIILDEVVRRKVRGGTPS